jgi:hypothetical protein
MDEQLMVVVGYDRAQLLDIRLRDIDPGRGEAPTRRAGTPVLARPAGCGGPRARCPRGSVFE